MKETISLLLSLMFFVSLGDELRPTTELNDVPGTSTLREMFEAGGGDGSATTNDLRDATNLLNRIKRDKGDLAVYEKVVGGDDLVPTGELLAHTSETSGLAKFGADGMLTAAVAGKDYIKEHQDISGKLDKSGGAVTGEIILQNNAMISVYDGRININSSSGLLDVYAGGKILLETPSSLVIRNAGGLDTYLDSLAWRTTGNRTLSNYGITDAVPLVEDAINNKTAVTIGSRYMTSAIGSYSLANGYDVSANGDYSHAEGKETFAFGSASHAEGYRTIARANFSHTAGFMSETQSAHDYAFVWNGDQEIDDPSYVSHGLGTFNINPYGGLGGFFIGDRSLPDIFDGRYLRADSQGGPPGYIYIDTNVYFSTARTGNLFVSSFSDIRQYDEHGEQLEAWVKYIVRTRIDANDSDFSNAVLAVGLNIDTNSVAVLNEIAATFGGFPIEGTATTVGGLLAALAAAAAWLKKNKVGSFSDVGGATATVENGVAKLDYFFTESNSLLTGTIDDRLPIPISAKSAGFTTESYKRFIVTVSGDMTVTLHTPTSGDAEIFECRFDGTSLAADASITFVGATATTMDTDCGTVKAGKVALMSAFWNGTTWDVNWKVEG